MQSLKNSEQHYLDFMAYKGRILNDDATISWEGDVNIAASQSGIFIGYFLIPYPEIASIEITDFASKGLTVFNSDVQYEDLLIIKLKSSYGCWNGCVLSGLNTIGANGLRQDEELLALVLEKTAH